MKILKGMWVSVAALSLSGCVAGVNVKRELDDSFWANKNQTVAIAMAELPVADHKMMGSQGLLDIAINKGNAKLLIEHLQTLKFDDYNKIVAELDETLRTSGFKTAKVSEKVVAESLPEFEADDESGKAFAAQDFRSLKAKFQADRLLLITVTTVGTERNYFGFIPTGAPVVTATVKGEMIDLGTNELMWRKVFTQKMPIAEPWDQEPNFPNVTRALEKVTLATRKSVVDTFYKPAVAMK